MATARNRFGYFGKHRRSFLESLGYPYIPKKGRSRVTGLHVHNEDRDYLQRGMYRGRSFFNGKA